MATVVMLAMILWTRRQGKVHKMRDGGLPLPRSSRLHRDLQHGASVGASTSLTSPLHGDRCMNLKEKHNIRIPQSHPHPPSARNVYSTCSVCAAAGCCGVYCWPVIVREPRPRVAEGTGCWWAWTRAASTPARAGHRMRCPLWSC